MPARPLHASPRPLGARGRAWQQAGHLDYGYGPNAVTQPPGLENQFPLAAQAAAKQLSKF